MSVRVIRASKAEIQGEYVIITTNSFKLPITIALIAMILIYLLLRHDFNVSELSSIEYSLIFMSCSFYFILPGKTVRMIPRTDLIEIKEVGITRATIVLDDERTKRMQPKSLNEENHLTILELLDLFNIDEKLSLIQRRLKFDTEKISNEIIKIKLPYDFPLNVKSIYFFFSGDNEIHEVHAFIKNSKLLNKEVILVIGNSLEFQQKASDVSAKTNEKWIAPTVFEFSVLISTKNSESTLTGLLAKYLSPKQLSPYQTGGGVNKEATFFGRRELIAQIINRDPANYLLVGGRQVGKSTLLKAIERRYADNPQVQCHYLTLSSEVLIPRLAALLKLDKTDDPEKLAAQLDEHIRHSGQRYLFLIDEADRFIAAEKANDYRILNVFRRLSEEGSCHFILAGFWQLYQHVVLDYQSPIRNFGELLPVGALEKTACRELAVQPMKTMNLAYANAALVEHLIDTCGQRANLIAIACQYIVRNLPTYSRSIEAGDVEKALRSDELRRALAGWSIGEGEQEQAYERMIVYASISMDSFSTAELLQLAQEHGVAVDTLELDRTLARLELAFIIGRDAGRWFYRVPLFVGYIREDAPAEKLRAELLRLQSSPA